VDRVKQIKISTHNTDSEHAPMSVYPIQWYLQVPSLTPIWLQDDIHTDLWKTYKHLLPPASLPLLSPQPHAHISSIYRAVDMYRRKMDRQDENTCK